MSVNAMKLFISKTFRLFTFETLRLFTFKTFKAGIFNRLKAVYNTALRAEYNTTLRAVIVSTLLFTGLAFAQSEADDDSSDRELERVAIPEPPRPAKTTSKPESREEVFKPSEEISEDSPVPFPVDI